MVQNLWSYSSRLGDGRVEVTNMNELEEEFDDWLIETRTRRGMTLSHKRCGVGYITGDVGVCMSFLGKWFCSSCQAPVPMGIGYAALLASVKPLPITSMLDRPTKDGWRALGVCLAIMEEQVMALEARLAKYES